MSHHKKRSRLVASRSKRVTKEITANGEILSRNRSGASEALYWNCQLGPRKACIRLAVHTSPAWPHWGRCGENRLNLNAEWSLDEFLTTLGNFIERRMNATRDDRRYAANYLEREKRIRTA